MPKQYYITVHDTYEEIHESPELQISTGIVYYYDESRSKWLSVDKGKSVFSINRNSVNPIQYLKINGIYCNIAGYHFSASSTITEIVCTSKRLCSGTLYIEGRRSGSSFWNTSIVFSNELYKKTTVNTDYQENDTLHVSVIAGSFSYPSVVIEHAFKL
jgi:hypothetical protein